MFVAMCVIWGVPYLLIRVAVRDLSPTSVVFARTTIGALILMPIAAWRGLALTRARPTPPAAERTVGQHYMTPKGPRVWAGAENGWSKP